MRLGTTSCPVIEGDVENNVSDLQFKMVTDDSLGSFIKNLTSTKGRQLSYKYPT